MLLKKDQWINFGTSKPQEKSISLRRTDLPQKETWRITVGSFISQTLLLLIISIKLSDVIERLARSRLMIPLVYNCSIHSFQSWTSKELISPSAALEKILDRPACISLSRKSKKRSQTPKQCTLKNSSKAL